MHHLTYVYTDKLGEPARTRNIKLYSPKTLSEMIDRDILDRIMSPYQEYHGRHRELILLENISIDFVEHSLFDLIKQFEGRHSSLFDYPVSYPPIILIDGDAPDLSDELVEHAQRTAAYVVAYSLSGKTATANLLVNRQFWDWWQIGGRWPMEFKVANQLVDIVTGAEVSPMVDMTGVDTTGHFTSAYVRSVDWRQRIEKYMVPFLRLYDKIKDATAHLPPAWKVIKSSQAVTNDERYRCVNWPVFDAWRKEVREALKSIRDDKARIEDAFFVTEEDLVGLTRREVIRFAIARAYCPSFMLVSMEGEKDQLFELDFFVPSTPTNIRNIIRAARRLKPDTVVIAVDVHN